MSRQSARSALRHATSADHERVDAAFSRFDLASRDGYGAFLVAQAAAHLPVEAALDAAGVARVLPDWPQRRRGDRLRADLAAMGLEPAAAEPAAGACIQALSAALADEAGMLGAVYVLEGSRLGGVLLRRSVPDGLPVTFLEAGDSAAWRTLLVTLDERLCSEQDINLAVSAAARVFAVFEASGRSVAEVSGFDD
ncbi:biliverdin-producing heme oxygenase [Sphingomonas sp. EC-HK361]|uniref:biliverdin-producing heme oxygenase n=1 Tax=Sphingomonas sp. EC-HK361 TaxID=2038397 RepID=UPI001F4566E5|nr:biliverdin-producing heme oxygenase [Sphingomonas sp. EC-HK361]